MMAALLLGGCAAPMTQRAAPDEAQIKAETRKQQEIALRVITSYSIHYTKLYDSIRWADVSATRSATSARNRATRLSSIATSPNGVRQAPAGYTAR